MKINTQIQEKAKKKQLYIFQEWDIQKKIAYEIANKNKCEILQINPKDKI